MVVRALTALRSVRGMNNTERAYSVLLEAKRRRGEIVRWDYEPIKMRLADNTYLTPDFRVICADGEEQFHETKGGFVREDAWIKLKLAAELHPYRFLMAQLRKGAWTITTV